MPSLKIKFENCFLIIVIVQFLHSTVEVIFSPYDWMPFVSGKIHYFLSFIPVITFPKEQFIVANMILIVFLIMLSVLVFRKVAWAIILAKITVYAEIFNALLHLSAAVIFLRYAPGCVTGIGFLVMGYLYFRNNYLTQNKI